MIDEKKIDESARDYINKNGYFVKYDEDPCVDIEYAYKDGVRWAINGFLNGLWHPAEEVPNEAKSNLLVQFKDGHFYVINTHRMLENTDWNSVNDMWDECSKLVEARRYLYIDDLLPKKGTKK